MSAQVGRPLEGGRDVHDAANVLLSVSWLISHIARSARSARPPAMAGARSPCSFAASPMSYFVDIAEAALKW